MREGGRVSQQHEERAHSVSGVSAKPPCLSAMIPALVLLFPCHGDAIFPEHSPKLPESNGSAELTLQPLMKGASIY